MRRHSGPVDSSLVKPSEAFHWNGIIVTSVLHVCLFPGLQPSPNTTTDLNNSISNIHILSLPNTLIYTKMAKESIHLAMIPFVCVAVWPCFLVSEIKCTWFRFDFFRRWTEDSWNHYDGLAKSEEASVAGVYYMTGYELYDTDNRNKHVREKVAVFPVGILTTPSMFDKNCISMDIFPIDHNKYTIWMAYMP